MTYAVKNPNGSVVTKGRSRALALSKFLKSHGAIWEFAQRLGYKVEPI